MSKINFLQKWNTKFKPLLLTLVVFIAAISIVSNSALIFFQETFKKKIIEKLGLDASIGQVFYIFPDRIFLKDTKIETLPSADDLSKILEAPVTFLNIAAFESIKRREIIFSNIHLKSARVKLNADTPGKETITGDIVIEFRGEGLFTISGWVDKYKGSGYQKVKGSNALDALVEYRIQDDKILIDSAVFKNEDLYFQFWGEILNFKTLVFEGFAFSQPEKKETYLQPFENIANKIKVFIKNIFGAKLPERLPMTDIYILDIAGKINTKFPEIEIENISFIFNNFPVRGEGKVLFSDSIGGDFDLEIFPFQTRYTFLRDLRKVNIGLSADYMNDSVTLSGEISADYKPDIDKNYTKKFQAGFDEINIFYDEKSILTLLLKNSEIFFDTGESEHFVFLEDLRANFNVTDRYVFLGVEGPFYGGTLEVKNWRWLKMVEGNILTQVKLHDVDANKLDGLIEYFSKIDGRLFGTLVLKDQKDLKLQGELRIEEGVLERDKFFDWLADSFDLSSLRTVKFEKANVGIEISPEGIDLLNIRLESQDVKVEGDYSIGSDRMVASEISLILSQDLLQGSKKFRSFLHQCENCSDELAFDFRLSGKIDALNFQWESSDVKTQIQQWMPNFIERRLEKNIEGIIDPVEAEE